MNLSGSQHQKVVEAIISAYPSTTALKMMVRHKLDKNLDVIAGGENLRNVVFNLMEWAESQGKLEQLLKDAHEYNPGNQKLKYIYKELFSNLSSYGQQQQDLRTKNVTTPVATVSTACPEGIGKQSQSAPTFEFDVITVNAQGLETKREKRQAQYYVENLGNNITLEMVDIPGGKFMMGSPEPEGNESEKPQHEVTVQPFFMGKYPITQAQWRVVAALPQVNRELNPDPSHFKGDDYPVECVSWYDVVEFCARLSKKTGKDYRLPSEAEWEYACRAGTTTPFHFGETLTDKLANYRASETFADEPKGKYRQKTTIVGTFSPNAFGLYDMHGNVWEWCEDDWHEDYQGAPTDGSAWHKKSKQKENAGVGSTLRNFFWENFTPIDNDNQKRLMRAGSWLDFPETCRCAMRHWGNPDIDDNHIGVRVVCAVPARTQ